VSLRSSNTLLNSGNTSFRLTSTINSLTISSHAVVEFLRVVWWLDEVVFVVVSSSVRKWRISSMDKLFVLVLVLLQSEIPLPKFKYNGVVGATILSSPQLIVLVLLLVVESRRRLAV